MKTQRGPVRPDLENELLHIGALLLSADVHARCEVDLLRYEKLCDLFFLWLCLYDLIHRDTSCLALDRHRDGPQVVLAYRDLDGVYDRLILQIHQHWRAHAYLERTGAYNPCSLESGVPQGRILSGVIP